MEKKQGVSRFETCSPYLCILKTKAETDNNKQYIN